MAKLKCPNSIQLFRNLNQNTLRNVLNSHDRIVIFLNFILPLNKLEYVTGFEYCTYNYDNSRAFHFK